MDFSYHPPGVVYPCSIWNASVPTNAAARDTLQAWGISVSIKRVERLTRTLWKSGLVRGGLSG